ncbi:uncharacterized protein LOC132723369 [Ruditapes philippinarum]|uniref:uncharacterized protein LOC132723369 n=1 Tax=Ruditapes philippinarum TaxID=129788 RepID=UPI00295AC57F|nr:uncharacterized protein LOC132723369 [Ruditapes philippinarum]
MQVPQDFSDDPFTINLYKKALQEGMELDHSLRVNVVGNFCQGKTSLVRRLIGESIDDVEMTNGIDISQYHLKHSVDGSIVYEKGSFFKDDRDFLSRIISIAKSIEAKERESVSDDKHYENIDHDEENDDVFRGDKIDIESSEELKSFLQEIKSGKLSLRSDFTDELSLWDFGGQYIFYATHTLFHSARAIYLLVFDLSCGLDDIVKDEKFPSETGDRTMEYFLKFWMNSIHSFVGSRDASHPPVILVGTHKDQLRGTDEEKQEAANVQFGKVRELFDDTDVQNHIQFEDFAIDNTNEDDKGIKDLKKELLKIARRDEFKNPIPAKWIHLEKSLYKLQKQKIITFEEVMKEDAKNEFPVGNKEGVTLFLQYHHARGTLVFFDEGSISNYVVLDPQYLVDAFKCIITSQNFCTKDSTYRPLWNKLTSKGILESKLIDQQWRKNDKMDFMKWRNVLLEILKKHCVIAEALEYDEKNCTSTGLGWYIVPSLLKDHSSQNVIDDFLNGKRRTLVRLVYQFQDSSVTKAEYDRLIATSLGMCTWSVVIFRKKHLLFKNLGVFRIGSNLVGLIEEVLSEQTIELMFVARSGEITEGQGDEFRRLAESVFNQSQRRRGIDNVSKTFTVMCRCNHASHGKEKSKLMNMSDLKTRSEVPCEDYENHTFKVQEAVSEWFLPERIESYDIPVIELSEKVLSRLSQLAFSDNWELLGVELGVQATKIDHLKEDYRTTPMKIFEMFRIWSRKSGDQATFQTLLKACKQVPSLKVNWDEIRNIMDDINKVQITHF